MQLSEVMQELEGYANPNTKRIYTNHGAREPIFGVRVGDLKKIVKKVKADHELSLRLFETGNVDAMYLAGLIAEPKRMTPDLLRTWARQAYWYMVSEYSVAGVAAEGSHGWELGLEWIEAPEDHVSSCGWATLGALLSLRRDEDLDLTAISGLMRRVEETIAEAPNRTRYTMNNFVICVGCYVAPLLDEARAVAARIGKVSVDMGGTACKVPFAPDYIEKVVSMGRVGKKRKKARC
ncbi:DNA alkylation repair protein [Sulfidibacter corallicola]|uniref:DNA alkylation repair protein n=1 Tax=Sulfidibacter corallicola TaxID=2818388 RepID=A0A8A4TGK1_SULCO|nr:DNA alkylation repair protein [Sulfidibacter corallicola]QTD49199.1 DNA alkylation repair protein [Sulfidibacter corallicola]